MKGEMLSLPVFRGETVSKLLISSFGGLDRRRKVNTGFLTDCRNCDTSFLPALASAKSATPIIVYGGRCISLLATEERIYLLTYEGGALILYVHRKSGGGVCRGVLKYNATEEDIYRRCMVPFNRYTTPEDPLEGEYEKSLLIFPDGVRCPAEPESDFSFSAISDVMPKITEAVVSASRLFGVDGDRIYASGFNDCANWQLDTALDISDANAWATTSQANSAAVGSFTGIGICDGHPVMLRRNRMLQIYGNKNPFRVVDIGGWGCIGGNAVTSYRGALAFVGEMGVYLYSGGYPQCISESLGDDVDYSDALLVSDGKLLYLYLPSEDRVFVYEDTSNSWGERHVSGIEAMAGCDTYACYAKNGYIYELEGEKYGIFYFKTDHSTYPNGEIRRIKALTLTCELDNGTLTAYARIKNGRRYIGSVSGSGVKVMRASAFGNASEITAFEFEGRGKVFIYEMRMKVASQKGYGG